MGCGSALCPCPHLAHYIRSALSSRSVWSAFRAAVFPSLLSVALRITNDSEDYLKDLLPQKDVHVSLATMISLCVVFHTVQSYSRFMTGLTLVYTLLGDLYDASGLLTAFCKHSTASREEKHNFLGTLVRLVSMLFALCAAEIEDSPGEKLAYNYDLIDPEGVDEVTLGNIHDALDRSGYVYQSILDLILDAQAAGVIGAPPPLLTRCFQELGGGMIKFHECLKFRDAPFPFPFRVVTDTLMLAYAIYTPFMFAVWTKGPLSAGCFTFTSVYCFWLLHSVANELDNPFGHNAGDLQTAKLCKELNQRLLSLVQHAEAPKVHLATTHIVKDLCYASPEERQDAVLMHTVANRSTFKRAVNKVKPSSTFSQKRYSFQGILSSLSTSSQSTSTSTTTLKQRAQHQETKLLHDPAHACQKVDERMEDDLPDVRLDLELNTGTFELGPELAPFVDRPHQFSGFQLGEGHAGQEASSALPKLSTLKNSKVGKPFSGAAGSSPFPIMPL